VGQKVTQLVFVRTSSNFHKIW